MECKNNIYHLIQCKNEKNFKIFLIYAIRTSYFELDFTYYLLENNRISHSKYLYYINSQKYLTDEYSYLKKMYQSEWITFESFLNYHRSNYNKISKSIILGRAGELINKAIFRKYNKKAMFIFKKLHSKIFESGIDFLLIKFNKKLNYFEYIFFEVKATRSYFAQCLTKINKWYQLENFTQKYIFELEFFKDKVLDNHIISDKDKYLIRMDLNSLAEDLIKKIKPTNQFFFCSSIFSEKVNTKEINVRKDPLLKNGRYYFFLIDDFFKNIIDVYKCLDLIL